MTRLRSAGVAAGAGQDYAPTYWVATAGPPPQDDGPVNGDMEVDVAVVGSGFTGLSAALTLARDYGVRAVVLEANRAAWGCTSRNGGQGQNASGGCTARSGSSAGGWTRRAGWTPRSARASNTGRAWWRRWTATRSRAAICIRRIGRRRWPSWRTRAASCARSSLRHAHAEQDQLRERYVDDHEAVGALLEPDGVGVHPLKLAYGYLRQRVRWARASIRPARCWAGARRTAPICCRPRRHGARAALAPPPAATAQGVNPLLDNRIMPVLSNSLVTRALSPAELEAAGLKSTVFITDTRCASTTGCCRTACRLAAAARSTAPTRRTRATWPCSGPGWCAVPVAARRGCGLFLVGLGGRQPT